jgi:hypothetical protein
MLDALLNQFTSSPQGSEALQTLKQEHGLSEGDAQSALSAAATGAADALGGGSEAQGGGGGGIGSLLGGLAQGGGAQGIMGALGGLAGGGGLAGALSGGAAAGVIDKIADVVAQKTGINKQTAVSVATTVLPHIVKFIQSRGQGQEGGDAAPAGGGSDSAGDAVGGLLKKLF